MKKSLIALAAMAAMGAASAQSSVTLYGIIDAGVTYNRTKAARTGFDYTVGGTRFTAIDNTSSYGGISGGMSGSRWGLKGQEDLGNGLSAVFNVEWGFNSLNGSLATANARRSVVGLKGGFGQAVIGRDYTAVDGVASYLAVDLVGTGSFYTGRISGIHYAGTFSGVSIGAFVGATRDVTVSGPWLGNRREDTVRAEGAGLSLGYETGPFSIFGAVQSFRTRSSYVTINNAGVILTPPPAIRAGSATGRRTEYAVGASYDFDAAKLFAHYVARKDTGAAVRQQMGVGVTVPFGAFTLGAQYAYNKQAANNGHNFALRGSYALSKRTNIYAQASRSGAWKAWPTTGAPATWASSNTYSDDFSVGIRHKF